MLHFKWKSEALLPVPYYRRFVLQAAATLCINLNQFRIRATYKTTLFNSRLHCNIVARIVATRVARSTSVILPEMKMSLNVFFCFATSIIQNKIRFYFSQRLLQRKCWETCLFQGVINDNCNGARKSVARQVFAKHCRHVACMEGNMN